jgi:hypothetical protein
VRIPSPAVNYFTNRLKAVASPVIPVWCGLPRLRLFSFFIDRNVFPHEPKTPHLAESCAGGAAMAQAGKGDEPEASATDERIRRRRFRLVRVCQLRRRTITQR